MNFLLYMLGRTAHQPLNLRPTPRHNLLTRAAHAAAQGDTHAALDAYRTLSDSSAGTPLDTLIRAHLHLLLEESQEAALYFAEGITRLQQSRASADAAPTAVERLLKRGTQLLAQGRYSRATASLRRARTLLEDLLAAEAGLLLAHPMPSADSALASLAHLSDLSLRLLARTQLAQQLAGALTERQLGADLAPWATSAQSVQTLLESDCDRLAALTADCPGHAENQYHLGLIARALGRTLQATAAFRHVLTLHPHHVSSAVRLAAADPAHSSEILRRAFFVPAATLQLFANFAQAARDPRAFDSITAHLAAQFDPRQTPARDNLAFALSELALRESQESPVHDKLTQFAK